MTEREQFIEDWMVIGQTFLPDLPREELQKRVEAAAEKHFARQGFVSEMSFDKPDEFL